MEGTFMEPDNAKADEFFEKLSGAIMNAITSSGEIKLLLKQIEKEGLIKKSSVVNLLLSLEELNSHLNPKSPNDPIYKLEPAGEPPKPRTVLEFGNIPLENPEQKIDGQNLTDHEKLFQEFCQSNFDQDSWLKKARIKF